MTVVAATSDAVVLAVAGELDLGSTKQFKNMIIEQMAPGRVMVLDLDRLRFCDSTGLGALAGLRRRAETIGGDLRLASPQPGVEHVLKMTGLNGMIPVFADVASALA